MTPEFLKKGGEQRNNGERVCTANGISGMTRARFCSHRPCGEQKACYGISLTRMPQTSLRDEVLRLRAENVQLRRALSENDKPNVLPPNSDSELQYLLKLLHESSLELSDVESIDELCRSAVDAARSRFGFDRASVWLVDDSGEYICGTYGIDENGVLRDEHSFRFKMTEAWKALAYSPLATVQENGPLYDDRGRLVGHGWHGAAPLRDRNETLGLLCVDNLLTGASISDTLAEILGLFGVTVGYSLARILSLNALRQSEGRFHALFEQAAVGMALLDKSGCPFETNQALNQMLGYSREEMRQIVFPDITHPDDRQYNWGLYEELVEGKRDFYLLEKRYICKDGSIIWGRVKTSLVRDTHGTPQFAVGIIENITERKAAEQLLWESEERFRKLFEAGPLGIALAGMDFQFQLVNAALCEMLGYTSEELQALSFLEITHPEDRDTTIDLAERGKAYHVRNYSFEKRYLMKSGDVLWAHVSIAPLRNREGEPTHYLGMVQNISARKRAEWALRDSETRYWELMEQSPDAISITVDGYLVYVNSAYLAMSGRTNSEVIGKPIYDFAPLDMKYQRAMMERRQRVLDRGQISPWLPGKHIRADGTPVDVEATLFPVIYEGQLAIQSMVRDVTERNLAQAAKLRAEEALRASERRFHVIFSEAAIGIALVGTNGIPIESNAALHQMLGYSRDDLRKMVFTEFTHPDDIEYDWKLYQELAQGKRETYQIEKRFLRKDGNVIWGRLSVSLVRNPDDSPLFGIAMLENITERKNAERSLNESLERLHTLMRHLQSVREEERTRVAREVHDELGQSLTGMRMGLVEMKRGIERSRAALDADMLLTKIASVNGMIEETIRSVRRIATELRPAILDTLGLIATLKWQAQDFQRRTGITCQFTTQLEAVDLDMEIQTAVFRIFQESLTNVLRHSKASAVRATLEACNGGLCLTVRDNGIGITSSDIEQTKSFGLLGMKERAHLLSGTLKIDGTQGGGTTITVNIPLSSPSGTTQMDSHMHPPVTS